MLSRYTLPLTLFIPEVWSWATDVKTVDQNLSNLKFHPTASFSTAPATTHGIDGTSAFDLDSKTYFGIPPDTATTFSLNNISNDKLFGTLFY